MLTPAFYARYEIVPRRRWVKALGAAVTANLTLGHVRIRSEGHERLPTGPLLLATNSTQKNDFLAFRWQMERIGRPCVTVTKAKNYHDRVLRFLLPRLGVVPLVSRGYLLLLDFVATLGRRPDDATYRALRDHLDRDAPLPPGEPFATLTSRPRALLDQAFAPPRERYRDFIRGVYARSLAETVRLSREAVTAGHDLQMYPEGTVSPRLGRGRPGAVQLAWALRLPIVPVGMSGCPEAFAGTSPLLRPGGGDITLRFGAPIELPASFLPGDFRPFDPDHEARHHDALVGFTDRTLMPALDALLDPAHRHAPGAPHRGRGTRAHL